MYPVVFVLVKRFELEVFSLSNNNLEKNLYSCIVSLFLFNGIEKFTTCTFSELLWLFLVYVKNKRNECALSHLDVR